MIEILPPLWKYKYDIWRILLVKCYIDNSVRLRSCIRNMIKGSHRKEISLTIALTSFKPSTTLSSRCLILSSRVGFGWRTYQQRLLGHAGRVHQLRPELWLGLPSLCPDLLSGWQEPSSLSQEHQEWHQGPKVCLCILQRKLWSI
jgi:hypothetical protein